MWIRGRWQWTRQMRSYLKWSLSEQKSIKLIYSSSNLKRLKSHRKTLQQLWTYWWFCLVINLQKLHHSLMTGILKLSFCTNTQLEFEYTSLNYQRFLFRKSMETLIFWRLTSIFWLISEKLILEWIKVRKLQILLILLTISFHSLDRINRQKKVKFIILSKSNLRK